MKRCTKCGSQNSVKAGFKTVASGKIQGYKCKECNRQFTGEEKFHHLSKDKIELRVHLRSVQDHLKKTS